MEITTEAFTVPLGDHGEKARPEQDENAEDEHHINEREFTQDLRAIKVQLDG